MLQLHILRDLKGTDLSGLSWKKKRKKQPLSLSKCESKITSLIVHKHLHSANKCKQAHMAHPGIQAQIHQDRTKQSKYNIHHLLEY